MSSTEPNSATPGAAAASPPSSPSDPSRLYIAAPDAHGDGGGGAGCNSAGPARLPSPDVDVEVPTREDAPLSLAQVREVVRLMQCPLCSGRLREPVTLPCGRTLCRKCLPSSHLRANISYPATASRLLGFQCPFTACRKEHATGDCPVDVTLNKALSTAHAELDNMLSKMVGSNVQTITKFGGRWESADVSLSRARQSTATAQCGGRLLGVYSMADKGELDYHADIFLHERINDISVAEEEELEARETRQTAVVGANPATVQGHEASPDRPGTSTPSTRFPTTIEDIEHRPTSELMEFAVDFVRRMQGESVRWLTTRMRDIYGECPQDPAFFPWWLASVLPVRDMENVDER
ncbi:hypothetical protein P8C59_003865 [Phyllachora maydis]|uniref:RING-type domain-containing protein n=1 Tax=Phyllachora maydis TaxID=1825666 RepID=A0AAD9MAS1_9PEZI|nr:hypothetical protein P8C59_003865 [Phyllachora maydis]